MLGLALAPLAAAASQTVGAGPAQVRYGSLDAGSCEAGGGSFRSVNAHVGHGVGVYLSAYAHNDCWNYPAAGEGSVLRVGVVGFVSGVTGVQGASVQWFENARDGEERCDASARSSVTGDVAAAPCPTGEGPGVLLPAAP